MMLAIKPVRASGSRWVTHKLSAMNRVISKYEVYTSHLATLSEDTTIKSADRAKISGYLKKWTNAKYILGYALFINLLTPCSIFSKSMQSDEIDILGALTSILRMLKEVDKLTSTSLEEWPMFSRISKKINDEDGVKFYQSQELQQFSVVHTYYINHYQDYCKSVTDCIKSRLAWSDLEMMRDIISILSTHGWEKLMEEKDPMDCITRLTSRFKLPLEHAGTVVEEIRDDFNQMMDCAVQYISLATLDYRNVWWQLFNTPHSLSGWENALTLVELLFSLPVSNGKVESVFSILGDINAKKQSLLGNDTPDDLLYLNADKVLLSDFSPDAAIDLWWNKTTRRPNPNPRRQYRKRKRTADSDSSGEDSDNDSNVLDLWDTFTNN